ncbi:CDP-glycerol glycerophosphotransferase family protein [Streptomyces sp. TRM66268-LWL]|uniref:CDP-glycerol glycerophosphotransferase family protein n=1 Tax=Streptomyces polyasparticus TaxID=2767826 RepID=A0ABR7SRP2_9ACTN|nr:CDP-glycerol glycerophosphotransferase family protein [Streptomyces polyasparticus]MBC9718175.1 CDP-glycerol glycerophosphotransferase family protein [Streptomyces polyasparticus]
MSTADLFDISVALTCDKDTAPQALADSVRSVLAQSLAGTEAALVGELPDHAVALAAEQPHRVHLGAPRGTFVIPLVPGELLDRNAARNLYAAAVATGADLVAGRWRRLTGNGRKEHVPAWQKDLYARSRTLDAAADAPELLTRDALDSGYCVRRAALPYPMPGLELALAARRIALVPNLITTRRAAPDPLRDLPAAAAYRRRADALLPGDELRRTARRVFLTERVLPCATALLGLGPEACAKAVGEIADTLDGLIDDQDLRELPPLERVTLRLLADGDAPGARRAAYALARPGTVVTPLTTRDGRVYWDAEHTDPMHEVTELGHQYRTFTAQRLLARVTRCAADKGRLLIEGEVPLPFGPFPYESLTARLVCTVRDADGRTVTLPVDEVRMGEDALHWSARVPLTDGLRPKGIGDRVWDPRLQLVVDGEPARPCDLFADPETVRGKSAALRARPRLTRLTADTWQPYVTAKHHLAVCLLPRRRAARKANAAARYLTRFRPARALKTLVKKAQKRHKALHAQHLKLRVYRRLLTRLPVRRGSVVFEAHMGKCYGDSPRAVYEELRARRPDMKPVWSYAGDPAAFPSDARLVRRWSWRYLWALARAEWWVDNQGFPHALDKPRHTRYLQTWHGSAYKRMGFDEIRHKTQNAPEREKLARAIGRFDHFLVRSEHDVQTLAHAYRIPEGRLLRVGYPRNDRLVEARRRDEREGRFPRPELAARLGIPDHRTIALYAPTFRGTPGNKKAELLLDVREFAKRFGDTHVLLVRAHYMETATLPATPPGTVLDVSAHPDVSEILCLTDVLITDYSSIMFDFALLDRPLVHFAPDLDTYAAERGSYFDLRARSGGPVVETQEELLRTLAGLKEADGEWQPKRRAFAEEFGTYDDGGSARAVVDQLFTGRSGGPGRSGGFGRKDRTR